MARAQSGFLCQSVMHHDRGLFSALGIGLSVFEVESLPAVVQFTAVAVVKWDEREADASHVIVIRVVHQDETVARAELPATALPWNDVQGSGTTVTYGVAFDARRAGLYEVHIATDGELLCRLPLEVQSRLPMM